MTRAQASDKAGETEAELEGTKSLAVTMSQRSGSSQRSSAFMA
jgi:hypothetical protein